MYREELPGKRTGTGSPSRSTCSILAPQEQGPKPATVNQECGWDVCEDIQNCWLMALWEISGNWNFKSEKFIEKKFKKEKVMKSYVK